MDETPTPFAELETGPSKFEIFLEENQKLLITAAVAIFLGVLGYVGFTSYKEFQSANAGEALSAALDDAELQSVISNHANTASAGSAALFLANNKADSSDEEAIEALRDFVTTYTTHPALPTATTNLGLRLLNAGKLDEAETQLNTVLDMSNASYIIPAVQIALGDIAKQRNNIDQATEFYNKVIDLIPDSEESAEVINKFAAYKTIASNRLRFIESTAPTEIQKKAATPEPASTVGKDEKSSQANQ